MTAHLRGSPRILCVDDDEGDLDLLQEAFQSAGIRCDLHRAYDGQACLDFLNRKGDHADAPRPDLILLDLNMPRMNGHEVLRTLKNDPELRRIPVVILSTSDDPREVRRCYEAHANSYIAKPDDFSTLVEIARSLSRFWFDAAALASA